MSTEIITVEHLRLRITTPASMNANRPDVLILGNIYGILPYQQPLAEQMAHHRFRSYWFAFSGQDDTPGVYCRESCLGDIALVVDEILHRNCRQSFVVLAHCAGSIVATEYVLSHPEIPVERLAIYGLLFDPARRREKAEVRMRESGVNYCLTDDEWHYTWLERLPQIRLPILLCHGQDKLNLARATPEELESVLDAVPNAGLKWFREGYDLRLDSVPAFADSYSEFFATDPPSGD